VAGRPCHGAAGACNSQVLHEADSLTVAFDAAAEGTDPAVGSPTNTSLPQQDQESEPGAADETQEATQGDSVSADSQTGDTGGINTVLVAAVLLTAVLVGVVTVRAWRNRANRSRA
jgi:hypothetical protein